MLGKLKVLLQACEEVLVSSNQAIDAYRLSVEIFIFMRGRVVLLHYSS